MHILIIEDEEQLCRSVAEGLRIDGYETDICFITIYAKSFRNRAAELFFVFYN